MHHRAKGITGFRSHFLEAVSYAGSDGKKSIWNVRCDCGKVFRMPASELQKGKQKSCGCQRSAGISAGVTRHGLSAHPAYAVWASMQARCTRENHAAWENYGGRGITVCPEWATFAAFWQDMGPTYKAGATLDRERNNEGYSKANCRWVSRRVQARNTRLNREIDTPKGKMLVCEAAELSGLGASTLQYRMKAGWPAARMFDAPDPSNRYST